ncbi:hypothetical protein [Paraburkholderia sp. BL10I2N1]|uniref:hypothetical protein n=1 Tax=Paraburkholderia sp. BL10I2N1 TaxID=1938796 RepID=UPI0010608269|nr:hypothetical protein [Paraburkholderia sp. BL10I2N1]
MAASDRRKEGRNVGSPRKINERCAVVDPVKRTGHKAYRTVPGTKSAGHGEFGRETIAAKPVRIAVNVFYRHHGDDMAVDVEPIEERANDG